MELKKRERIISDLEHCKFGKGKPNCEECNYKPWIKPRCWQLLCSDALALINELTEEIKDLETDYDRIYAQAEADIRGNMADGGTSCHWCIEGHKRDTIEQMQTMIKEECIAGGIWPAFVARVVENVGKKLLEDTE